MERQAAFKKLSRRERRAIRAQQIRLAKLSRDNKRAAGGRVSLEIDPGIRRSLEAHMLRRESK